jgi:hypothetical protein
MRVSGMLFLSIFALGLGLGACDEAPPPTEQEERSDEGSFDIIPLELGESLTGLSVERLRVDASTATHEEINRSMKVLRLHVPAGQSVSIAMRAEVNDFDSYLLVKDGNSGASLGESDDQSFVASAGATDSLVALRAGAARDVLILATGGETMTGTGSFTIDAIVHDDPFVDLTQTGPGLRSVMAALRVNEPEVQRWFEIGGVIENDAGLLELVNEALDGMPLSERVEVIRLVGSVNSDREVLFEQFLRQSDEEGASQESVGRAVAPIYQLTRTLR